MSAFSMHLALPLAGNYSRWGERLRLLNPFRTAPRRVVEGNLFSGHVTRARREKICRVFFIA